VALIFWATRHYIIVSIIIITATDTTWPKTN